MEILASLAILLNGVIYGTDVFGAIILRPAVASVDDRTLTQLLGHIHRIADRRLARSSIPGLITTIALATVAATGDRWASLTAAALAAFALIAFVAIYNRVRKPINLTLTAAAIDDRVPDNARQLQARWNSVINARVALQTIALAGLCVALAAA